MGTDCFDQMKYSTCTVLYSVTFSKKATGGSGKDVRHTCHKRRSAV